jgi:SAM-dependent methyltransferase
MKYTYKDEHITVKDGWDKVTQGELDVLLPHLGRVENVLDLGCGLGRMSVALAKYFPDAHYDLVDGNGSDSIVSWSDKAIYNDLKETAYYCKEINHTIYDIDKQLPEYREYDLVMSWFSCGFHYDMERYKDYFELAKLCALSVRRSYIVPKWFNFNVRVANEFHPKEIILIGKTKP